MQSINQPNTPTLFLNYPITLAIYFFAIGISNIRMDVLVRVVFNSLQVAGHDHIISLNVFKMKKTKKSHPR